MVSAQGSPSSCACLCVNVTMLLRFLGDEGKSKSVKFSSESLKYDYIACVCAPKKGAEVSGESIFTPSRSAPCLKLESGGDVAKASAPVKEFGINIMVNRGSITWLESRKKLSDTFRDDYTALVTAGLSGIISREHLEE